jgi:tRNA(Arg) A34 adenosine deaminase TadA
VIAECTLYASTEPCFMCSGAAYWAGVRKIVFGCSQETLAKYTKNEGVRIACRDIFAKCKDSKAVVIGPVLEDEAKKVHEGYWSK